jgi:hypothetical protein
MGLFYDRFAVFATFWRDPKMKTILVKLDPAIDGEMSREGCKRELSRERLPPLLVHELATPLLVVLW